MMKYCRSCGRRFDPGEIGEKQFMYYGYTICKRCWIERSLLLNNFWKKPNRKEGLINEHHI